MNRLEGQDLQDLFYVPEPQTIQLSGWLNLFSQHHPYDSTH
ncbi:hypothetical protein UUU_25620 [Klebsiella pneumoniae subsp. pneumoniae DSM 30104 = JCM 1662 = NBRC 14940]|nr:hypothetical protein UUU_25620 [Klebsiella pneumoniae subsp. pneumoniae DSM 30104 = JCM 1662 = NBRC 14940]